MAGEPNELNPGSGANEPTKYRDRPSEDGRHGDAAEEQRDGAWSDGRDRETKKPRGPVNP